MKVRLTKLLLVFAGILLMNTINAQQVTLDDLMKSSENTEIVNGSSKKWINDFNAAEDIQIAKQLLSVELTKMTKSKHWLSLSADGEITKELSFQTSKKMYLDRMIENLKEAGFVLSNTKIDIDTKTFIYSKNNVTVEVLALATETTAQTVYLVTLL
jgi:hypothetical protein